MRTKLIAFFKTHPVFLRIFWALSRFAMRCWAVIVPFEEKSILFSSFGGRKFDDSPKAIYEEICNNSKFKDWKLIWAFIEPDSFYIPRGEKVKVDTKDFFKALLKCHVWISNSGMSRGIGFKRKRTIRVETWHGTPLKKIGGEENQNSLGGRKVKKTKKPDAETIRCAQSEFDQTIFERIFNADKSAILLCDLPRNDNLLSYDLNDIQTIRTKLGIPEGKKVLLYMPTYREFLLDENNMTYMAPPMDIYKWQHLLEKEYVLLIRAHYAVNNALNVKESSFVKDVSGYPFINDLYALADVLISDYSSAYFDYSILDRPMLCFAYDKEEYEEKRGLYLDLGETLPCSICRTEDEVLEELQSMDYKEMCNKTAQFHHRFAPHAGNASKAVVGKIIERLNAES